MKTQIKNFGKVGVCFFLMSGMIHAQTSKKNDTLREREIEDVVIVGYKTQKKSSLTAAVSIISDKKLKDANTSDVSSLLQGKAAGVQVMQGGGAPGSSATVQVRGTSTINGPSQALWVVDGVMMNDVPNLDPNQIESINILKDATSTALYGSRGANGVVQVFTKSGSGKGTMTVSVNNAFNTFTNGRFKLMNGTQLYDNFVALKNAPAIPKELRNNGYDWLKNGTQTGVVQNYTIDFRGSSQNSKTYISGNYYDESGTVKGYDFNRLSFRINHDQTVKPWLTLKPKLSVAYTQGKDRQGSLYEMYLNMPWDSPYDANGNLINPYNYNGTWYGRDQANYLHDLQWNYGKSNQLDLIGNFDAEIKFTDYLKFISTNSVTYKNYDDMSYVDMRSISGESNKGSLTESYVKDIGKFFNQMIRFDKDFGKSNVNALAAYEYSDRYYKYSRAQVFGVVPGTDIFDTGASTGAKPSGAKYDRAYNAFLFNAEYVYDKKYFVQGSLRNESSSAFGAGNRNGMFYSYSLGWNIHKEKFFNVKQINEWKLRASRGLVGNTPSPNYGWQDLYALTQKYNGEIGATWSQLGNPALTWESIYQNNIGTDLRMFNNRLTLNVDYFNNKTKNLLMRVTLPSLTGVDRQYLNVGDVRNKGWEFNFNYAIIKKQDLSWDLGFNISTYQNRVLSTRNNATQILDNYHVAMTGYDVNSFYMRKWMGVNSDNGKGQWEVVNADGSRSLTTNYNAATVQVVGASTPDYYGSVSTNLTIKNFYLNANFYFSQGGKIYNSTRELFDSDGAYPYYNQMVLKDSWSRWQKPGDVATHPEAIYNNNTLVNKPSSRYLEDASYVKLRSLRIGYNFPASLTEKIWVKNASIYIMGENLFTITKFSGVDPEVGAYGSRDITLDTSTGGNYSGNANVIYPVPRRISLGFNFSF
ncbi:TPA: SusC/RagA family TonB-linked outer membrane protein [Elizabethkingia anophelis]|uniref:SusC/RagA family TonB-linked outer membrane protein n=1 Tax=Elizabethkingia anophelis TaxID=1117645 RepID=UPI0003FC903C|nr:SusC/RagA family TonB-linked outer membrane protein [Elizabethkingia anophelis]MCT3744404.1 SusC/RagA family TonB-linked outer membrane protein [Elizabethkingia anophelis]MDC8026021.1 SusC/RagA family TonB-linked outer membrane protein [Elizabethkingia anophelis]MDV3489713.1 SusC/RagA family TonB-linked outer membrane protein [Elizabethkingia anophelis]MDV4129298.1 SusC/RagA family TonB-linked outer membrane protein [Elizabethkingia anophelis]MDV4133097.1 SusC/RagA family TonB-linked outer 